MSLDSPYARVGFPSTPAANGATAPPPLPAPLRELLQRLPDVRPHPSATGWMAGCPGCGGVESAIRVTLDGATWHYEAICGHRPDTLRAVVRELPTHDLPPPGPARPAGAKGRAGDAPARGGAQADAPDDADGEDSDDAGRRSQATLLVRLARARYRFARSESDEPVAIPRDGPPIALPLRGERAGLRAALADAFFAAYGRVATAAALTDALTVLEGEARRGERVPLALRLARWRDPDRDEDAIVLDLGREDGQVVVIRPGRWEVGPTPAGVVWRRTRLTAALPLPERGGDLSGLRALLNLTDAAWDLFIAAIVAGVFPDIPHAVEFFRGPEGSGKSTAARLRVQLVDPSPVPLRAPPKSLDDWQVAAAGSWTVAVDNISAVPDWLQDALCRAATGDGLVKRALYTNDELAVLAFRRVVTLTAIDAGALRGDLADRLVWFELDRIADEERREDAAIAAAFARGHAAWLGALCDLVARVLAVLPDVRLSRAPRLADYARVLAAVDRVAGTRALATYLAQRGALASEVVEADAVATAVADLARARGTWSGTASELFAAITPERPPRGWPADAARLSHRLRQAAEALRRVGVTITFSASRRHGRVITLTATAPWPEPPEPSASASESEGDRRAAAECEGAERDGNGASPASPESGPASPVGTVASPDGTVASPHAAPAQSAGDGGDAEDAGSGTLSFTSRGTTTNVADPGTAPTRKDWAARVADTERVADASTTPAAIRNTAQVHVADVADVSHLREREGEAGVDTDDLPFDPPGPGEDPADGRDGWLPLDADVDRCTASGCTRIIDEFLSDGWGMCAVHAAASRSHLVDEALQQGFEVIYARRRLEGEP